MKTVKIKYVDFWKGFNPDDFYIHQALKEKYNVSLSNDPDILIYSCFGNRHRKYHCTKLFYTGENIIPNFNECDYAIGFCYMEFEDRYFRSPNYLMERKYFNNLMQINKDKKIKKDKFCIMINSNPSAMERIKIFNEISKYKRVDSGGKTLNNIGYRVKDKIKESKKYKFSIAVENSKSSGYCTEKIVDAFASNTIPIYYGDPNVFKIFNKKAFVYIEDINQIDAAIEEIKRIDNNDKLYEKYLREKKLVNKKYIIEEQSKLKKFLYNIVEKKEVFYKNEENHLKRFINKNIVFPKKML